MSYTPPVRKTRSEHQLFVQRLRGRSASERVRLQREHTAYLASERENDAEFDDEPTRTCLLRIFLSLRSNT
ncbi:M96 mating-specific protein [Phytophthora megakarya]|uniref:M96 mating-specific protein n=1 Tax=Phytophthora megakarya TaxID=4795 RepID=A0A225WCI5_9STRA|nr:M96 mating-specific protein [Phytophthora megakarya]